MLYVQKTSISDLDSASYMKLKWQSNPRLIGMFTGCTVILVQIQVLDYKIIFRPHVCNFCYLRTFLK